MVNVSPELLKRIDVISKDRDHFIQKAIEEKLEKELSKLLKEGYSKEKNLEEWEVTSAGGIE